MRNRFVTASEPVRLPLADVYVRAHTALVERKDPEPTLEELADSQARVDEALAEGAWIEIRPQLSAGEARALYSRSVVFPEATDPPGARPRMNWRKAEIVRAAAFLVGWNLEDDHGPVDVPAGDDEAAVEARELLLELLEQQTFADVYAAIDWYDAERTKGRRASPTTARRSDPTSGSRA